MLALRVFENNTVREGQHGNQSEKSTHNRAQNT